MNAFRLLLAAIVCGGVATSVSAQSFTGAGLDPGDGVIAGGTNSVTVTGVPSLTNMRVEIDLTWTARHTWIGDLTLRLTGPNAATVDLINRPGKSSATAGFGDNGNFLGTYTFRDTAAVRLIDVANPLPGTDDATGDIPSGAFRATSNLFNDSGSATGFTGEQPQTLDTSFGTVGNGNWTLFMSDSEGGDYAPLNGWVLRFVPVPEPTSVLAIGAGVVCLAGFARRRRLRLREPVLA